MVESRNSLSGAGPLKSTVETYDKKFYDEKLESTTTTTITGTSTSTTTAR